MTSAEKLYGNDLNSTDVLVQSPADRDVLLRVASSFGLNDVRDIRYPAHYSTTSKKAILDEATGSYFVKQKAVYASSEDALLLSGEFQNYVAQHQLGLAPELLRVADGAPYCTQAGRQYIVYPEIEGDCFVGRPGQIYSAGRALAEIHNLSDGFMRTHSHLTPPFSDSHTEARRFIDLAANISGDEKDEHRDMALTWLANMVKEYSPTKNEDTPAIIAHGDFTPSNLLFSDDEVVGVIDFDNVAHHARIRDLGEGLLTFCGGMNYSGASSSLRTPIATRIDTQLGRLFLKGYESALEQPLSTTERRLIPREIALIWVEHMGLGIVRGDFGFRSILDARSFMDNIHTVQDILS